MHLAPVDPNGIVVQVSTRQHDGLRFRDFALRDHLRQSGGQRRASGFDAQPVTFLGAQGFIVRKAVGSEGDFVPKSLQPLFEQLLKFRGIKQNLRLRCIQVNIFGGRQPDGLSIVG